MNEKPILFSAPMVQAILAGKKIQTRRICKRPTGHFHASYTVIEKDEVGFFWYDGKDGIRRGVKCPYGQIGDQLWVRETWQGYRKTSYEYDEWEPMESPKDRHHQNYEPVYKADNESFPDKWFPAIHMPREFSRIQLEITDVRVEPLQNISTNDCIAEGIQIFPKTTVFMEKIDGKNHFDDNEYTLYKKLWESINGQGSWEANPWVWVIEFRKVM